MPVTLGDGVSLVDIDSLTSDTTPTSTNEVVSQETGGGSLVKSTIAQIANVGAGAADSVTLADTADTTTFPVVAGAATGDEALLTDASNLTYNATTGALSAGIMNATATVSAGDNASVGYAAANGLELTGQGSTNDLILLNDDKATVARVLTGTQDLTLGAGIHIGGAGAANLLSDYETAAFVVAITASTGTITIDTGQDDLTYLKLGPLVYIFGKINISSVSSPTSAMRITGLPFTVTNSVASASTAAARITGFHADLGTSSVNVDPEINTTRALLTYNVVGTQGNIAPWAQGSGTVTFGFFYQTDS